MFIDYFERKSDIGREWIKRTNWAKKIKIIIIKVGHILKVGEQRVMCGSKEQGSICKVKV